MITLLSLVIVVIVILNWQTVKDSYNGKHIVLPDRKPWKYSGWNGYHRERRKNSFNGMKRFFKKPKKFRF
jgi:hypothetical protein